MKKVMKIIFVAAALLSAQGVLFSQTVTWQRVYDYNNFESEAFDAIQTFDGGYLILNNNFFTPDYSVVLIKVNYLGNIEWQKLIDNTLTGFNLSCYSVSQAVDSGYIVSGFGSHAILFKTNVNGDLLWVKTYPRPGLESRFFDHKITRDGSVIATGDLYPPFKGRVVKTDNQGNVQWDSTYNYNLGLSKIIQSTIDESYYFTARDRIIKVDSIGRLIWTTSYNYIGGNILQTQSGDVYTATGDNDFYLNKIDTSGNLIWQKKYYPNSRCTGFCLSKDGNLLLTGFPRQALLYEIFALKTDLNGNEIFGKTITSFTGNYFALPLAVHETRDSGFIFSGVTDFPQPSIMRDNAFATKTDSACNAPIFVDVKENLTTLPNTFKLYQNYPNPFNPSTMIIFDIYKPGFVNIELYNATGRKIANILNGYYSPGNYKVLLNSDEFKLSSGIYFLRMNINIPSSSNNLLSEIKKLIYLK